MDMREKLRLRSAIGFFAQLTIPTLLDMPIRAMQRLFIYCAKLACSLPTQSATTQVKNSASTS